MPERCRFCSKFSLGAAGAEPYDRVLFESSNFVAIPTIGSILPGWLLVVPRAHFLCIGAFNAELMHEFVGFRDEVASALCSAFGPVACFEHGPSRASTSVGCGVDHAHLHLVATTVDLRAGANHVTSSLLEWKEFDQVSTLSRYYTEGLPYLYVHQFGKSWISSPEVLESQIFRKVIASAVGKPEKFDWKQHSFISAVEETIARIDDVRVTAVSQAVR